MNHVSTLINGAMDQARQSQQETIEVNENAKRVVDSAFESLKSIFPGWQYNLKSQNDIDSYKQQMTRGMIEQGVTNTSMIKMGMARARLENCDFMPSVGKFLSWCKPSLEAYGLPDAATAARQYAANRQRMKSGEFVDWTHPAVYVAGQEIPSFDFMKMNERDYNALYERNYDIVCRRVFSGEDLYQAIPKALPKESKPAYSKEYVSKYRIEQAQKMKGILAQLDE